MTQIAWKQRTTIQPGGVIQIHSAELPIGAEAEIIVLFESPVPTPVPEQSKSEQKVDQALRQAGLILEAPVRTDTDTYRTFQPIIVKGKPLSDTILEERR